MLSLKVRFIPYSNYIQRTKRSNYASSSRLQEYENSGNSETVKQKSGCGRFRQVVVLKGYNCSDLAGKILVLLIGGCLWEVVEHGRSIAKT